MDSGKLSLLIPCFFINKALFYFMKHQSHYGKVPFEHLDALISKVFLVFLFYQVFLTNCSWNAHILMKSALLNSNPFKTHLLVNRDSY